MSRRRRRMLRKPRNAPLQGNQSASSPLGPPRTQQGCLGTTIQTQDSEAIRWLVGRNRFAPIRPPSPVGELLTGGEPEAPSPGAQSTAGDAARAPA
eukprot:6304443-Pyramimonas_sp.AAC.1